MLALALEVCLLGLIVHHSQAASDTIACAVVVFAGLWFGFPLAARSQRR
jgi:hypothetical protein